MNVYERIVQLLKQEPLLQDFKYLKSTHAFVKRTEGIRYMVVLEHSFFFNIQMWIQPEVEVRYEVLHKWFEKFSFKTISDQRDNSTIGASTRMVGFEDTYYFKYDGSDFAEVYPKLREAILTCMERTFTTFATLEDFYNVKILPLLEEREAAPAGGVDWVTEYLTACRILHPESYSRLKKVIMDHLALRIRSREPNAMMYDGKWDEIFEYLESLDFSSGKARLPKEKSRKRSSPKDTTTD